MPPKLVIEVVGDTANFERAMNRTTRAAGNAQKSIGAMSRGALSASVSFRGMGRSIAFASGAFLGGAGFVAAVKSSVAAASNLAEQTSKTDVVFGRSADTVKAWSKTTSAAMGLAQDQALETASSFGALLRPLGLTGAEAAKQSTRLTKLGADLASFYNTSVSDALQAIRSGLVGESEPLRRYGVLLSEARVQAEALAQTGKTTAASLTQQEKVLARQALIFRDSAQAQGDFQRTSGGLANQQRILSANIRELQIGIGNALIPTVLEVTTKMNDWLSKSENQKRVTDEVRAAVSTLRDIIAGVTPVVQGVAGAMQAFADAVGGARNAVKLLGAAFIGLKFAPVLQGMSGIGSAARTSAGRVATLRGELLRTVGPAGAVAAALLFLSDPSQGFSRTKGRFTQKDIDSLKAAGLLPPEGAVTPNTRAFVDTGIESARSGFNRDTDRGIVGRATAGVRAQVLKSLGLDAFIPKAIELQLARARTELQERSALGAELEAINKALRRRLTADDRIALEREKTQILSSLKSMNEAEAQERQRGIDQAVAARKRAVAKEEADRKAAAAAAKKAIDDRARLAAGLLRPGVLGVAGGLSVADVNRVIAGREQAAQFRALGLTATGEVFAPTGRALAGLADRISRQLSGTIFDTDENRNAIARVRKVLTGQFGALTRETRLKMEELLRAISDPLKDADKKLDTGFRHVSPGKLAEALGLGSRGATILSQIGAGGLVPARRTPAFAGAGAGGPLIVQGDVILQGAYNMRDFEQKLEKRARARAKPRRG